MTIFFTLLAALVVLVLWRMLNVTPLLSDPAPHGRMSERWLAEHRASSQT